MVLAASSERQISASLTLAPGMHRTGAAPAISASTHYLSLSRGLALLHQVVPRMMFLKRFFAAKPKHQDFDAPEDLKVKCALVGNAKSGKTGDDRAE